MGLSAHIGFNLVLDGIGDMINGLFGSTAGTNYGENNSLMVITRNYWLKRPPKRLSSRFRRLTPSKDQASGIPTGC